MKSVLALSLLAACQVTQQTPSIPWLHGLADPVTSNRESDEVARRIDAWSAFADVDPECSTGAYPGIAIEADVAPVPGKETVMVSLSHGIVVVDHAGKLVTEVPGSHCDGTADELEAVAAGDAFGASTIAIAVTSGGRRESSTWLTLFRVNGRRLDPVFSATVEERSGTSVQRGDVFLVPGALLYRHPRGTASIWIYNSDARSYMQPGQQLDNAHDGPDQIVSER